jgi:hypothetical protein
MLGKKNDTLKKRYDEKRTNKKNGGNDNSKNDKTGIEE